MRKQTPATESTAIVGDAEAADEPQASAASKEDDLAMDIEAEIAAEVKDMRKPTTDPLFTNVKVEVQCGMFVSSSYTCYSLLPPNSILCIHCFIPTTLTVPRTFFRCPTVFLTNKIPKYSS